MIIIHVYFMRTSDASAILHQKKKKSNLGPGQTVHERGGLNSN